MKNSRRRNEHQLRINPINCRAHGLCADLLPEMVSLDEWGYPILPSEAVPEALLQHARRAAAACPSLALRVTRPEPPG
jgi:ferredoxin